MRAVGEIPSSNNLRLQNRVESQLEMTKTESRLNALSAKFALNKFSLCASRLGLLIYSLQDEAVRSRTLAEYNCPNQFYTNRSAIRPPTIQRDFELKPQYYTLGGQTPYCGNRNSHCRFPFK
ncbi:hypothetical protein F2Q68_00044137 [Brassica cretica]|uniref:Uncharacterized protein n=2 Tax=Brassica cretica TaxID=69181 RepID=A0A8S9LRG9_BRACR|nr:hypothetical protein F2Q68_00044137 [Brassica cretica]KAF3516646.1 hypothetical protein DY000_02060169 [Brassica cretica]